MKSILIGLMVVAVASAGRIARKRDVSEYYGAGWTKGADGYTYDIPQTNLDNTVSAETYYETPVYSAPVAETTYTAPAPAAVEAYVEPSYTATAGDYEVASDYFVPETEVVSDQALREYLPPALRRRRLRLQKRRLRFVKRH